MRFLIVVRPTERGYEAHAPDLDGCLARGRSRDQVERQMRAVLELHVTALRLRGEPRPEARAYATHVEIVGDIPQPVYEPDASR